MCVHTGDTRYTVNRESGFNIVIELVNQTTSDSGDFFVRAELREAGENIRFCVYKNFTLSVTGVLAFDCIDRTHCLEISPCQHTQLLLA